VARWEDALDAMTDVYKFWHSDMGRQYARGFLTDREVKIASGKYVGAARKALIASPDPEWDRNVDPAQAEVARDLKANEMVELYRDMDTRFGAMAFNSDPIYVDPDVWTLVKAAAETWHGEPLHPSDLPTQAGFLLLPEPMTFKDVWGKSIAIRAINWHPMEYVVRSEEDGSVLGTERGILMAFYHATRDRDDYSEPGESSVSPWLLVHAMPWFFSKGEESGERYEGFDIGMRLQVCWRMMQQEIAVTDRRQPGGQFAKRAKRLDIEKRVVVVTLRRPKQDVEHDEVRAVDWAKRWVVSGHWRRQWYATLQTHRLIWIAPFVKGPDDKPLVINRARAFQFVR
jgi:hypothetical protein